MNTEQSLELVKKMKVVFDNLSHLKEETIRYWAAGIVDLPYNATRNTLNNLYRTQDKLDGIATVRRETLRSIGYLSPPVEDAVRVGRKYAYYIEQRSFAQAGYQPDEVDEPVHPAVKATVRAIGEWDEKSFRFTYKEVSASMDKELAAQRLPEGPESLSDDPDGERHLKIVREASRA